ncbi:MAG: hypothetical protein JW739_02680 [Opitutales bacterium]|nr:hypothetical protein [Opitutales bacterium]
MTSNALTEILPLAIIIAIIAVVAYFVIKRNVRQRTEAMHTLAQKQPGLELIEKEPVFPSIRLLKKITKSPYMRGTIQNRALLLDHYYADKKEFTRLQVALHCSVDFKTIISSTSVFRRRWASRNLKKVTIEFLPSVNVLSTAPEFTTIILSLPETAQAIELLWKTNAPKGFVKIEGNTIYYSGIGALRGSRRIEQMSQLINICTLLAESIEASLEVINPSPQ